jgi:hypothetical protein
MNINKKISILLLAPLLQLVFTTPGTTQDIVRVNSEFAAIHVNPESMGSQIIPAKKGDLFELAGFNNNGWVSIQMFSGKIRYLKTSDVEIVSDLFSDQVNLSKLIGLCQEVQLIEDQAIEEANSKYPEDHRSAETYKYVMIDKEVLTLFRNNNIPATQNSIFLDCINDSLYPFLDM